MSALKILITGSTGLVGNALVSLLSDHTLLTPSRTECDFTNQAATRAYFEKHKPHFVFHLAAKVGGIAANIADPISFFYDNMQININVIHAAQMTGVKKLLYLGSSCMYPKDRETLHENDLMTGLLEPTNEGYGFSKIAGLLFCKYINTQLGYSYKVFIPTNLYGEHDHFDLHRAHLVPAIIRKLHHAKINRTPTVEIWGDGKARREFMYVGDLVNAMRRALNEYDRLPFMMNIGLGYDYSVDDYYRIAAKAIGYEGKFFHDVSKPAGMQKKLLDVSQAKSLGFEGTTTIEDGIRKVYQYAVSKGLLV